MKNILFLHAGAEMYGADKVMLDLIKRLDTNKYNPLVVLPTNGVLVDALKKENVNYYVSPITSGDCFVTDSKVRDEIYNRTKATIVDMESASIGHISRKNNVPFVCIRTVSDFADGNDDFEKEAGERSTEIVKKIIENL